jgi:hypothetical protein
MYSSESPSSPTRSLKSGSLVDRKAICSPPSETASTTSILISGGAALGSSGVTPRAYSWTPSAGISNRWSTVSSESTRGWHVHPTIQRTSIEANGGGGPSRADCDSGPFRGRVTADDARGGRQIGQLPPTPAPNQPSIGAPGFEPGTSPTRTVRATRLRHAPTPCQYPIPTPTSDEIPSPAPAMVALCLPRLPRRSSLRSTACSSRSASTTSA